MSRKRRPPRLTHDEAEFEGELAALLASWSRGPAEMGLPEGSPMPEALAALLARPARQGQLYRLWLRLSNAEEARA